MVSISRAMDVELFWLDLIVMPGNGLADELSELERGLGDVTPLEPPVGLDDERMWSAIIGALHRTDLIDIWFPAESWTTIGWSDDERNVVRYRAAQLRAGVEAAARALGAETTDLRLLVPDRAPRRFEFLFRRRQLLVADLQMVRVPSSMKPPSP